MKHIKDFDYLLNEALKISQIREYIKLWDETGGRERYSEWFNGKFRIYLDLSGVKSDTYIEVEEVLEENGYYVVDYYKNIAKRLDKEDKNPFKIGRLLNRFATDKLQTAYAIDKDKEDVADSEYKVVISRHPYDVVGMSTDRKWHSCMNLVGGANTEYLQHDVKEGSIVAYLVSKNDLNINKPVNRLLIKPFEKDGDTKLSTDAKIYKAPYEKEINGFRYTVEKWLDEKQGKIEGVYKLKPSLYSDGKGVTVSPRIIKMLNKKYDKVDNFDNIYSIVRKDRLYGVVDVEGNEVLPLEYSDVYCYGGNNDIANTFYELSKRGNGIKEVVYFRVSDGVLSDKFSISVNMVGHTIAIAKDRLFGIMDLKQNFKLIHDYEFEDVYNFDYIETYIQKYNIDIVFLASKEYMYGVIDINGNNLIPFEYDEIDMEIINDEVYFTVELDGEYGLYDRNYKMVIPVKYSRGYIRNFFDELIRKGI